MFLSFILILCILSFSEEYATCSIEKKVPIDKPTVVSNHCFYIDLREFRGYLNIKVKVTVKKGYFNKYTMYYGVYEFTPNPWSTYILNVFENYDSKSYGTKTGSNYDYYTQHYYIRIENYESSIKYYFFSIPAFSGDYVEIELSTSGITIGAIIGIVFAGFFVSTLIIVIVCVRIKKKTGYNSSAIEATQPYTSPMNEYDSGNIVYNPHFEQANSN